MLATQFGFMSNTGRPSVDSSPANIRIAVEGSLRRLGTDYIDLYYQHGDHATGMMREAAEFIEEAGRGAGVLVTARRTFDIAHAWGGKHPMDVPIVVVTHRVPQEWVNREGSPFTFVTEGVPKAIELASERTSVGRICRAAPGA